MSKAHVVKKPASRSELAENLFVLRATKAALFSLLSVLVIGLLARVVWHIPVALGVTQLVVTAALLVPLTYGLSAEPRIRKLNEEQAMTFSFSVLAAALAYINFLFYFVRQGLDTSYASTKNPYYFEASAVAVLTTVFCQFIAILFLRAHDHEQFFTPHLKKNRQLWQMLGISLLALAIICYVPSLRRFLGIGPLSFIDWLWVIVLAGIYTGCRLLQRHTRKHSRSAIIELHRSK